MAFLAALYNVFAEDAVLKNSLLQEVELTSLERSHKFCLRLARLNIGVHSRVDSGVLLIDDVHKLHYLGLIHH